MSALVSLVFVVHLTPFSQGELLNVL